MRKGFTLIELMIVIAIIAIIASIAIPNLLKARTNANQTAAKAACGTVMTEVSSSQTSLGHLPRYTDLSDYLDSGIYDNMSEHAADTDAAGSGSGYKSYGFTFLVSREATPSSSNIDSQVRGVEACPKLYNKGGKNSYYRTNETGTTWQADAGDVHTVTEGVKTPFFTTIRYNSEIKAGGTYTTGG